MACWVTGVRVIGDHAGCALPRHGADERNPVLSVTAVVGCHWGDEGKGKLIDYLAATADMVVRYNGGANAGHSIHNEFG